MTHVTERLIKCCELLDIDYARTFRRNSAGNFERLNNDTANRAAVIYLMRAWQFNGRPFSFIELAEATSHRGHSMVIDAVNRVTYYRDIAKRLEAAQDKLVSEGHRIVIPTRSTQ